MGAGYAQLTFDFSDERLVAKGIVGDGPVVTIVSGGCDRDAAEARTRERVRTLVRPRHAAHNCLISGALASHR
jgi:hypothetical protein